MNRPYTGDYYVEKEIRIGVDVNSGDTVYSKLARSEDKQFFIFFLKSLSLLVNLSATIKLWKTQTHSYLVQSQSFF